MAGLACLSSHVWGRGIFGAKILRSTIVPLLVRRCDDRKMCAHVVQNWIKPQFYMRAYLEKDVPPSVLSSGDALGRPSFLAEIQAGRAVNSPSKASSHGMPKGAFGRTATSQGAFLLPDTP